MSAAFDAPLGPHAEAPVNRISIIRSTLDLCSASSLSSLSACSTSPLPSGWNISEAGGGPTTILPFLLLGVALLIALGFEFVNGFHDTANAVATVIYTHALPPQVAVVWSGCWNFIGVLVSTGAVAFGIISLLPVELILQVGSGAGFAMVFALLIAAIIWNLGTWWFGLPASSSHTLIGSIIGVGLANAIDARPERHRGRRLGPGHQGRQGAAVLAAGRLRPLGAAAAGDEGRHARAGALQGARTPTAAAALDPRPADPHLHAGHVLPRLQRRPEGHGPHHADPDRHRADGLCAQPRAAEATPRQFIAAAHAASKIVDAHGAGYATSAIRARR